MPDLKPTEADDEIASCIDGNTSFTVIAGAGSGKTTSLIEALNKIRCARGSQLRERGQKVVCITYTNRAVAVISSRLGFDALYFVTTLHGFLWGEVSRFQAPLREALVEHVIPGHIDKGQEADNGGNSQRAIAARKKLSVCNLNSRHLSRTAHL